MTLASPRRKAASSSAFSQDELAAMVGASRESVARALARLRAAGLLETRRRGVALIDVAALRGHGR